VRYIVDPLVFLIIYNANDAIPPYDLVAQPGRVLAITTPQGAGGATGA
jgi:hypothetical protein